MNVTPKKLLNSDTNCFICSAAVTSKQRVRVFKSGSTGTSSFDLQGLINKALDIDVNVYSNSDVAVCIKCYKSLVKYQKAEEHVKEIKTELKSAYSSSGRRVKRLLRTENINELTAGSGTSVKKHLSFVSLTEFPTTCSSSNLTPSSSALPRLTISPIGKPQGCLFDNGTFSLVRSAFAAPFVTSSPKIKQTNQQKNETKTKVVVEYPSKTVNKTLSGEMEPIVKALAHGPPSRIAKTVLKCKTLRTEIISQVLRVVASEMNELCSKKNPSILRKTSKDDLINFDMKNLCDEWKERAPVFYSFLLTCSSSKNTSSTANWFPSIAIAGSVLLKQRNSHMNASASVLGILIKTGSMEVIFCTC